MPCSWFGRFHIVKTRILLKLIQWNFYHPRWHSDKESARNARAAGDMGSVPGLGRSPGGGHSNPLQYSCLENPMAEEPGGLHSIGSQRIRGVKIFCM